MCDISATPHADPLRLLKAIRGARGGMFGVARDQVEQLISLAHSGAVTPESTGWRRSVQTLLREVVAQTFGDSDTATAVSLLLGLEGRCQGMPTQARRCLAAEAVGYAPTYFRRRVENDYLEEVAASIESLQMTEAAEGSLRSAVEKLVGATGSKDPRFVQQALDCGLAPILRLAQYPEEIRRDFRYHCELEADMADGIPVYRVRGEYGSIRVLPNSAVHVVVCRSLRALREWFDRPDVISAEYAPLANEDWERMVETPGSIDTRVMVDGVHAEPVTRELGEDSCVTTFAATSPGKPARVEIRNRFVHSRSYREVTIRLRNHFCFGAFEVELVVADNDASDLAVYDYVAGVDARDLRLYGRSGDAAEQDSGPNANSLHARVHAGPDVVIWPGSGVHFAWRAP